MKKADVKKDYNIDIGFSWVFSELMYYRDKIVTNKIVRKHLSKLKLKHINNDSYLDEPIIFIAKIIDILIRLIVKRTNSHSIPYKNI